MKKSFARIAAALSLAVLLLFGGCQPSEPAGGSSMNDSASAIGENSSNTEDTSSTETLSNSDVSSNGEAASSNASSTGKSPVSSVASIASIASGNNSSRPSNTTSSKTEGPAPTGYVQKQFYIATWRAVDYGAEEAKYTKVIKANKEAGINLIENAVLSRDEGLLSAKICEREGVDFLISNITGDRGYTGMGISDVAKNLDDDLVKSTVNEMKDYKHLVGYYVWDEVPQDQFDVCRKNIALFEKYDPKRLAFTLLFPSYGGLKWYEPAGTTIENSNYYKYVTEYVKQVDPPVLCFDYYALKGANTPLITNNLWKDLGLFRKEAVRTNKPLWWYFQAYDTKDGTVGHMTRAKLAVQMFAGVAYGCKTVSYYQSLGSITDKYGTKTSLFEDAKSLNAEVQNVGNLFFQKKPSEIYHFGLTKTQEESYFLDDVSKSSVISDAPDKTIVSVFTDNTSAKYVMVVNKDYTKVVKGNLVLKKSATIEEYNKVTNKFSALFSGSSAVYMNIKPGDCVIYRIS